MLRKKARIFYFIVIALLVVTTLLAMYDGGYNIGTPAVVGLAVASIVTSLLPFFVAMSLFRKFELNPLERSNLKVWGWLVYAFCFPVKLFVIYANIDLLIHGGAPWAFG